MLVGLVNLQDHIETSHVELTAYLQDIGRHQYEDCPTPAPYVSARGREYLNVEVDVPAFATFFGRGRPDDEIPDTPGWEDEEGEIQGRAIRRMLKIYDKPDFDVLIPASLDLESVLVSW